MSTQEQILQLLLGQIPEAIYFAVFMLLVKQLKTKRLLYIGLMIVEYILLKQFIHFNIWFQVLYTFMSFVILKVLYKEKAQVIDIFTFSIASIILIGISIISFIVCRGNMIIGSILNRGLLIALLIIFRNKLNNIQKLYKKMWNRNDKVPKKIKSVTFRAINATIFNLLFYILNICMLIAIKYNISIK